jgi:hypothetical protein
MIESVRGWVNTLRMRRISRSGLDDWCCGACRGKRHHASAAFETEAKENESGFGTNMKTGELLNA